MTTQLYLSERLAFTTIRITARCPDGRTSIGTGFLFQHTLPNGRWYPALYTNKHVIEDAEAVTLHFAMADSAGLPILGRYYSTNVTDAAASWVHHPDPEVDLCAITFGGLIQLLAGQGIHLYLQFYNESSLLSATEESELGAVESVMMIGYPTGLWDSVNNRPVMRRGVTATHPAVDFEGKAEFLVDIACFPGSSGSPVVLYTEFARQTRNQGVVMSGPSAKLLGVLYAGPQYVAEGKISFRHIPTDAGPIAQSMIPMNLGLAIKARRVMDLAPSLASFATP
jgi:hypothetical protein